MTDFDFIQQIDTGEDVSPSGTISMTKRRAAPYLPVVPGSLVISIGKTRPDARNVAKALDTGQVICMTGDEEGSCGGMCNIGGWFNCESGDLSFRADGMTAGANVYISYKQVAVAREVIDSEVQEKFNAEVLGEQAVVTE
jgi:hypothetical protein